MFFDARALPSEGILEADICIVGAGAAGIALAMEFQKTPLKVLVLESGGFDFEHRSQFLYQGESSGRAYQSLEFTRRRQFGGTTHIWFGRCRPLDEIDFQERSYLPHSGWPFSRAHLDPYYARAHMYCQLERYDYDPDHWAGEKDEKEKIGSAGLEIKIFKFSPPTNFGRQYRSELEQASSIHVFLRANVTGISLDQDGKRVSYVRCATLQKKTFRVKAREYILAASGLEVTRLLLVSKDLMPSGIGNQHDLVGRFFMEHPHIFSGVIRNSPGGFSKEFFKLNYETGQSGLGLVKALGISEARMAQEQILNASAFFVRRPLYKADDLYYSGGITAATKFAEVFQHTTAPSFRALHSALNAVRYAQNITALFGQMIRHRLNGAYALALRIQTETIPNPDSRVTLSDKRDVLGVNRLNLHWQLTRQDLESYSRFETLLQQALNRIGFQVRKIQHDVDSQGWPVSMMGGKHQLGTTRMHNDPRRGVVDMNCRVHAVDNLYIASGSVFPTCGMANPTLTIVALAIRLADHLKQKLGA